MTNLQRVWKLIAAMEDDLANVERWGLVLSSMGVSGHVEPDAVFVVGDTLIDAGRRLGAQFQAAANAAQEENSRPCA